MPSSNLKLLVIDDEEAMREVLRRRLGDRGFDVRVAADGEEAVRLAAEFSPDVVLSDVVLPDRSGIELLGELGAGDGGPPVVLITAHGTVSLAVEAMKNGAHDFLTKPIDFDKLDEILRRLEPLPKTRERGRSGGAGDAGRFGSMLGESDAMRAVFSMIREVAPVDASVLITGESGTGKELVARTLHELSGRRDKPFVAINSAAIPRELMESEIFGHEKGAFTGATGVRQGCFELAHEGTLFLDEIAEMPIELQPKLLRVLEDGCVRRLGGKKEFRFDARVLAATNREPGEAIEAGTLRKDLYYRLNVFSVEIPPLRQRKGDLKLLLDHFVSEFAIEHDVEMGGVADETLEVLERYDWPGNVRELRNACERAVVLAGGRPIEPSHLPPDVRDPKARANVQVTLTAGTRIADAERELILRTLEETGNNKAEAARRLGVDVKTVRNKLKSYGLDNG